MDEHSKRTIVAVVLCAIVFLAYMQFIVPKNLPVENVNGNAVEGTQNAQNGNVVANNAVNANENAGQINANNDANGNTNVNNNAPTNTNVQVTAPQGDIVTIPTLASLKQDAKTFITPLVKIQISPKGGKIISFKLRKYKKDLKSKAFVDVIDVADKSFYPLGLLYDNKRDDNLNYEIAIQGREARPIKDNVFDIGNQSAKIIMKATDADGVEIQKVITLYPNSYLFDVSSPLLSSTSDAWIEWISKAPVENDRYNEFTILNLNNEGKVDKMGIKEQTLPVRDLGQNTWLASGYKYFETVLVPQTMTNNTRAGMQNFNLGNENYVIQGKLDSSQEKSIKIYVGPRDKEILKETGFSLERSIDLGFFSVIAYPLLSIINFLYSILGNYGLAIVLLTLIIKMIFLPLTSSSIKSMKKMQDLQPRIKELREKYKNPNELNKQMMDLYKRYNVNPMGGCLPMLVQIPVFFGLYVALLNSINLRHANFALWITDLSSPEKLYIFGFGIPVMILLMGFSMFWQQKTTPSAMDPAQQKAMLITPIIFTVIFLIHPFPSGLVLYWLTNNMISIVQQKVLRAEGNKISPFKSTCIASVAIFGFAFILTLF